MEEFSLYIYKESSNELYQPFQDNLKEIDMPFVRNILKSLVIVCYLLPGLVVS